MASRIPPAFIQELLARVDIVELIKSRIKLSRSGSNYQGLCPFHTEKTPSFSVSQTKQFYHCFGCGVSGNSIGFLMAFDRLSFLEAIEQLASQTGLTIPKESTSPLQEQQRKLTVNQTQLLEKIAGYYQAELLQNKEAQTYLQTTRKLSAEIIERYRIGYAPAGWDYLMQRFNQSKREEKIQLIATGMLIKKERENHTQKSNYYDRFRNRLMYPIRNARGQIIAFGARAMGDEMPKYLNSPETPLFHKGSELYGLYEACQANKKLDTIFIVEGYMDVIALAQFGITNAVATLGTAFSPKHIQRIQRYAKHIIFCFDGDKAGYRAAWSALTTLLPLVRDELQIQFMFLPEGEDPDTLIRKEGQAKFIERANNAVNLTDFFFNSLTKNCDLNTVEGCAKLARKSKELLYKLPNGIFKSFMLQRLAKLLKLDIDELEAYMALIKTSAYGHQDPNTAIQTPQKDRQLSTTHRLLALLLQKPKLAADIKSPSDLFSNLNQNDINLLLEVILLIHHNPDITTGALIEHWREKPPFTLLSELAQRQIMLPETAWKEEIAGALMQLTRQKQKNQIQNLLEKAKQQALTAAELQTLQALLVQSKA